MSPSLLLVHAKADSGICKRAFNGCKLPFESTLFQRIMVTNIMRHATLFLSRFFAIVHARVSRKPAKDVRPRQLLRAKTLGMKYKRAKRMVYLKIENLKSINVFYCCCCFYRMGLRVLLLVTMQCYLALQNENSFVLRICFQKKNKRISKHACVMYFNTSQKYYVTKG